MTDSAELLVTQMALWFIAALAIVLALGWLAAVLLTWWPRYRAFRQIRRDVAAWNKRGVIS